MAAKDDLRYIKTEEALQSAALELLQKIPYRDITVSMICSTSGCSRNAFYQHYERKSDLYRQIIARFVQTLSLESMPSTGGIADTRELADEVSEAILSNFYKNKEMIMLFWNTNRGIFTKILTDMLARQYITLALSISPKAEDIEYKVLNYYSAAAITGFVAFWLFDTDLPYEQALELFKKVQYGVSRTLAEYLK